VISSLFYNLFCGNMQDEARASLLASSKSQEDASASAARSVSTYLSFSPLSGLLNPILGYCIDHYGFRPMLTVTLLSGTVHALALRFGAFFQGAAVFSLFQASFFSYMYSYLAFEFGFEYYGLLAGLIQSIASMATLILRPCLSNVAADYGWPQVQLIQAASFGLLGMFLVSTHLLRRLRQQLHTVQVATKSCNSAQHLAIGERASLVDEEGGKGSAAVAAFAGHRRSYSEGDLHSSPVDQPCRRRSDFFPSVDDILLIDGAYPHESAAAYELLIEDQMYAAQAKAPITV